jgi:iron complex outermembrane receptor protein
MQLVDGVRLFVGAGTVTFPFDTWNVDRVEVLRGPASIMYGQGAIGGAINVVSRRPNTLRQEAQTELAVGENGRQRASFDSTGPLSSTLAYRVDVSGTRARNWIERGDSESLALAGTLQWRPSDHLRVLVSHDYGDQSPMQYFGTPLLDGRLDGSVSDQNYNVTDSDIRYKDGWSRLKADWDVAPEMVLSTQAYALRADRLWRNVEEYSHDRVTDRIDRASYISIIHHQRQLGAHGTLKVGKDIVGRKNSFAAGADFNRVRFTHNQQFSL